MAGYSWPVDTGFVGGDHELGAVVGFEFRHGSVDMGSWRCAG